MSFRQVHLDFHTSEFIENIGENFSKENFQNALKEGHVNSITVFSKCHHGWSYHPTKANEMHPHLKFDLLGKQIEWAHEIGVKTPVYLSASRDEKSARIHPEWLARNKNETTMPMPDMLTPGWHNLCFNTDYLEELALQVEEVVKNYDADGIFMDICGVKMCYCQKCVKDMTKEGIDISDEEAVRHFQEKVYLNYAKRIREAIDKYKPGLPVFHNGGHIKHGRYEFRDINSHLELESLPTGGWGYDHFPMSASYVENSGMEYLGMTGKFHTTWGEFGGYKHPNALLYETALSNAFGAKCSIGDQLHPSGKMDMATYKLIGNAYSRVEKAEEYVEGSKAVCDIAVLSSESCIHDSNVKNIEADVGANRILLEGKYLFSIVDTLADFSPYKLIILPDAVKLDKNTTDKLKKFISDGGKILAAGDAPVDENGNSIFDFGIKINGKCKFKPAFLNPKFELNEHYSPESFVIYSDSYDISEDGCTVLAEKTTPYFNREPLRYCSHQHFPDSGNVSGVGMALGRDGIYIPWQVFTEYARGGSVILKNTVCYAIDTLLGEAKTLKTDLQSLGVVTLRKQIEKNCYILHTLYASPIKRGRNIEVIEDLVKIKDLSVSLSVKEKITGIKTVFGEKTLDFTEENGRVNFIIPEIYCSEIIKLQYENK